MADHEKKSRKRSGGKAKPPKNFQIYLDENLCNCQAILDVLNHHGIQIHRHFSHFKSGAKDEEWLDFVGSKRLLLLTTDKGFRYNAVEKELLITYNVQSFEFSRNNKGAKAMAEALDKALPKMINFWRSRRRSFIASISPSGKVTAMWDAKRRERRKTAQ
jgi:hypothetical protein